MLEQTKKEMMDIIEGLYREAIALSDKYWDEHMMGNERYKNHNELKSYLTPQVRKRGDYVLELSWGRAFFIKDGSTGKFKKRTKYIPKKSGYMYNLKVLHKNSPPWAHDLVTETEMMFAHIRKRQSCITKMGIHLRHYEAAVKAPKPNELDKPKF